MQQQKTSVWDRAKSLTAAASIAFLALSTGTGPAMAADVWTPKEGTPQYDMLLNYQEFVKHLRGCCNLRDGRGGYGEIFYDPEAPDEALEKVIEMLEQGAKLHLMGDESVTMETLREKYTPETHPYFVIITHDLTQTELSAPYILPIPKNKVIVSADIAEACQPRVDRVDTRRELRFNQLIEEYRATGEDYDEDDIMAQIEEEIPDSTCIAPPFSLTWIYDNSAGGNGYSQTLNSRRGVEISNVSQFSVTRIWCYYPKPVI